MELTITEIAMEKINEIGNPSLKLLLWYETEGCGCGVNGVPTFQLINEPTSYDKTIICREIPTFVRDQQVVFFAKDMKLDFINGAFRLLSREGILNPFISPASIHINVA
ncbi:iron-sulfur cluster biosynthesis family protein [Ornithinibacillus salinisoli]|uniref:Iron-sulfur cluster biosynthesis family protein n=1 Tax=Ornithinibacillus salinisoli TaxID=1848459 RepID=A0ABW4W6H9_9BACI